PRAGGGRDRDSVRGGPRTPVLRPGRGAALLADSRADGSCLQSIPRTIPRQTESVALFLGEFRPGHDAFLGAAGAAAPGWRTELSGLRDAGGVLTRMQQLRI